MSVRDTLAQLGFVMIGLGSCFATWALITGPLGRYTERWIKRGSGGDRKS